MFYVRWYMRRHFHAVRLLKNSLGSNSQSTDDYPNIANEPVFFCTNHPSWWDPLVFLSLGKYLYPDRLNYGPIDAKALSKYKFLQRIGFIGIEPNTWAGAARFLRMAHAANRRNDVVFWITSQGEFCDPRARPIHIRPGVGHAVERASAGLVVPCVIEYPFWNERSPEVLVAFGEALRIADAPHRDAKEWNRVLADALEATQDRLAAAAKRRDPQAFTTVLSGRAGVGGVYDFIRRIGAWRRGERFDASHGGEQSAAGTQP